MMVEDALTAQKIALHEALRQARSNLIWKLEGLSERQLRRPCTPTGFNLLGVVKHCAYVETGYFGDTFGREWPVADEIIELDRFDDDPQADWYATAEETPAQIIDFAGRVWAFADETITTLPLDAPGAVAHWPDKRRSVTLGQIMVHVLVDLARHLGQADIVREDIDGAVGMNPRNTNIPEDQDWDAYRTMLTELAEGTSGSR